MLYVNASSASVCFDKFHAWAELRPSKLISRETLAPKVVAGILAADVRLSGASLC